jgi:hypothetical protein
VFSKIHTQVRRLGMRRSHADFVYTPNSSAAVFWRLYKSLIDSAMRKMAVQGLT